MNILLTGRTNILYLFLLTKVIFHLIFYSGYSIKDMLKNTEMLDIKKRQIGTNLNYVVITKKKKKKKEKSFFNLNSTERFTNNRWTCAVFRVVSERLEITVQKT